VKKYLIVNARKLLEALRKYRASRSPVAKELRDLNVGDVVMRFPEKSDVEYIESLLSYGDYSKHRRRIQDQEEGRVAYVFAWAWGRIPIGHILVHWDGGHDGQLSDLDGRGPLLEDLHVHPAVWGRGVGTMIMDEAERVIESNGYDRVGMTVYELNPATAAIYQARGYEHTDLEPFVSERVFTDKKGRERKWSRKGIYLVKRFKPQEDSSHKG
jgi:GNAT superfamily N-acetyltransferase